ncbi:MAG: hypothetical protein DRI90_08650 [Deltaproteobacteria bacterium]|nr:MAG: hypothetical protein DRI90_08650 [Deltaproteobacteria bacterium]
MARLVASWTCATVLTLAGSPPEAWADASAKPAVEPDEGSGPIDLSEQAAPDSPPPDKPAWETALHERRCGLSLGIVAGGMLGAVEGFPNDSEKIDRELFFTETGSAGGGQVSSWIGVAITDYFVFGLGGHFGALKSSDHDTSFFGGNFHIDAFPLYTLGGEWRELGLNVDAGVSTATTSHVDDPDVGLIESGGASRVAVGVFYEGFRWWKLSMGPFATYDQLWSTSAYRPTAWIGWRTAFYVGPR